MRRCCTIFFFFNDTATTEIYTLSLHDALPILDQDRAIHSLFRSAPGYLRSTQRKRDHRDRRSRGLAGASLRARQRQSRRSEEHTSELQSPCNLVCRLLLEKNKIATAYTYTSSI